MKERGDLQIQVLCLLTHKDGQTDLRAKQSLIEKQKILALLQWLSWLNGLRKWISLLLLWAMYWLRKVKMYGINQEELIKQLYSVHILSQNKKLEILEVCLEVKLEKQFKKS